MLHNIRASGYGHDNTIVARGFSLFFRSFLFAIPVAANLWIVFSVVRSLLYLYLTRQQLGASCQLVLHGIRSAPQLLRGLFHGKAIHIVRFQYIPIEGMHMFDHIQHLISIVLAILLFQKTVTRHFGVDLL